MTVIAHAASQSCCQPWKGVVQHEQLQRQPNDHRLNLFAYVCMCILAAATSRGQRLSHFGSISVKYKSVLVTIGVCEGGTLIRLTSPSSYNPEQLAPTVQAKPFCEYISETQSHISTVVVCRSSLPPCWRESLLHMHLTFVIKLGEHRLTSYSNLQLSEYQMW